MKLDSKSNFRSVWKQKYKEFLPSAAEISLLVISKIKNLPCFTKANVIGLFHPRPFELNLLMLLDSKAKKIVFPKTNKTDHSMQYYPVQGKDDFELGYGGVQEPKVGTKVPYENWLSTDIILIPGFAFDTNGARVGSGKGFYDRYLSEKGRKAIKIGVCYDAQLFSEEIPIESYDVKMDVLITEKRSLILRK